MIRGVLGLFFFAVALCAYIVISPADRQTNFAPDNAVAVTRAQTDTLLPGVPLPPTPQATAPVPQTPLFADPVVTPPVPAPQKEPEVLITVPSAEGAIQEPEVLIAAPSAEDRIATDNNTIASTTNGILAGLGIELRTPAPDPGQAELASRTNAVLAEIGAITGNTVPEATPVANKPAADTALERLIVASLREGHADDEIDRMINAAAIAGELTVPEVLVTSDGRIDTHVLLQSIIVQATIAAGGAEPLVPDTPTGDGTGVEVRVVKRAVQTEQYRFYTVGPGDSLGAIAVKFYGNVDKFPVIYNANRNILTSPNDIKVGQRLTIPDLPEV